MENGILLQTFEWETSDDGNFYKELAKMAPELAELGVSAVWMPPAAKGTSPQDVGYGNYDYWDLGEFEQHGTVRTKYGTREELEDCIRALHDCHIHVYADMVFNHKGGADETETFQVVEVDENDRTKEISEPHEIEGWTHFTFAGRGEKYSSFQWHWYHFNGIDYDQKTGQNGIFRILGENKYWNTDTDSEKGNFDYLMNADIDHDHPEVREELERVSRFMIEEMGYDGFRYDALKHISRGFIDELSRSIKKEHPDFYFVGEYWQDSKETLEWYLNQTEYSVDMFDVPLHFNFYEASRNPEYDIRQLFDNTVVRDYPTHTVTFVDNHDSQPGQSLQSWVDPWFKEIAYAVILFRKDGYPCVFRGDLTGISGSDYAGLGNTLRRMMRLRKRYAYGEQDDYAVTPTKFAWVRRGDEAHPEPLAVLISTGDMDEERLFVGEQEAGKSYMDWSGKNEDVVIDEEGFGLFTVAPGAVTYWTARNEESEALCGKDR